MRSSRRRLRRRFGSRRGGRLGQRRLLSRLRPPIPISRRRSAAGGAGTGRLRSGAGGRSDSPVPARRPPALGAHSHDEPGRQQPVGRHQLPDLHQLPESAAEGTGSARGPARRGAFRRPGLGLLGRAHSWSEAPRDPGHLPHAETEKRGRGWRVEGEGCCFSSRRGTDWSPEGLGIFIFYLFLVRGVLWTVFRLILPHQPAPRAQGARDLFDSPAGAAGGGRGGMGTARAGGGEPGSLFAVALSLAAVFVYSLPFCLPGVLSPNTPFLHSLDGRLVSRNTIMKRIGQKQLELYAHGKCYSTLQFLRQGWGGGGDGGERELSLLGNPSPARVGPEKKKNQMHHQLIASQSD